MTQHWQDWMNQALANGGRSDLSIRIVHSAETVYEQGADMHWDLAWLSRDNDGYMDEVHALRAAVRADLVHLIVPVATNACGVASLTNGWLYAGDGFAVTAEPCGASTFTHEVGPNLGMHHDSYVVSAGQDPAWPWAFGFVDPGFEFRTIMAYGTQCYEQVPIGSCPTIQYFSAPASEYNGKPIGIAPGIGDRSADNLRVAGDMIPVLSDISDFLHAERGWGSPQLLAFDQVVGSRGSGTYSMRIQNEGSERCPLERFVLRVRAGSNYRSDYHVIASIDVSAEPSEWVTVSGTFRPNEIGLGPGTYEVHLLVERKGPYYNYGNVSVVAEIDVAYPLEAGWNMIGNPFVGQTDAYTAFPTAIPGTLFTFGGTYAAPSPPDLVSGSGYWLRFPSATTVPHTGVPMYRIVRPLRSGWNLVSGPACSFPWSAAADPNGILIPGTLFSYDGSYQAATGMDPGLGYWMRTSRSGQVTLDCAGASSSKAEDDPDLASFSTLWLEEASGVRHVLRFGGRFHHDLSPLAYSLPPSAPGTSWAASFSDGRYVTEGDVGIIRLAGAAFPVTVTADRPLSLTAVGSDGSIDRTYSLSGSASSVIAAADELRLGIAETAIPTSFLLKQAYPNPFRQKTTLPFSLPEPGPVRILVFDMFGRDVSTVLSEEDHPVGLHHAHFDASGLASGVYVVRLEYLGRFATQRLVITR